MGTTAEKLQYTLDSVNDIQNALIEKGVEVLDTDPLGTYGDKVRSLGGLESMNIYRKYCDISAGTWTGATLSNSSWVSLGTSTATSTWTYYFDTGVTIDVKKIEFISASIIETQNHIRLGRGYASNSTTPQYQYLPYLSLYGDKNSGDVDYNGGLNFNYSNSTFASFYIQNNPKNSSTQESSVFYVRVYENRIVFEFDNDGRSSGFIKSTTPKFKFSIGYTN